MFVVDVFGDDEEYSIDAPPLLITDIVCKACPRKNIYIKSTDSKQMDGTASFFFFRCSSNGSV